VCFAIHAPMLDHYSAWRKPLGGKLKALAA
jgi:hypothetical protein